MLRSWRLLRHQQPGLTNHSFLHHSNLNTDNCKIKSEVKKSAFTVDQSVKRKVRQFLHEKTLRKLWTFITMDFQGQRMI